MTRNIKVKVFAEFAGSTPEDDLQEIIEVPDDATEDYINAQARETAMQLADEYWSWAWEPTEENET